MYSVRYYFFLCRQHSAVMWLKLYKRKKLTPTRTSPILEIKREPPVKTSMLSVTSQLVDRSLIPLTRRTSIERTRGSGSLMNAPE